MPLIVTIVTNLQYTSVSQAGLRAGDLLVQLQ